MPNTPSNMASSTALAVINQLSYTAMITPAGAITISGIPAADGESNDQLQLSLPVAVLVGTTDGSYSDTLTTTLLMQGDVKLDCHNGLYLDFTAFKLTNYANATILDGNPNVAKNMAMNVVKTSITVGGKTIDSDTVVSTINGSLTSKMKSILPSLTLLSQAALTSEAVPGMKGIEITKVKANSNSFMTAINYITTTTDYACEGTESTQTAIDPGSNGIKILLRDPDQDMLPAHDDSVQRNGADMDPATYQAPEM